MHCNVAPAASLYTGHVYKSTKKQLFNFTNKFSNVF